MLCVEALRLGMRFDQAGPLPRLSAWCAGSFDVPHLDAGTARETLNGVGELDVLDVLHEPDHVPAHAAPEAVEQTLGRGYGQ